ncbi:MAG: alpha/beta fold hydrolase [Planctomycetota bacterium]|nr:alpha/beta fold hydrolase [Planctomycetota bacterium]
MSRISSRPSNRYFDSRHMGSIALLALACSSVHGGDFKTYDAETFFNTTTMFGASFTHDEKAILFTSDASGIFNVYRQPVEGGKPIQMTFSEDNATYAVSAFPEDDRFLFEADTAGNELTHIFVRTPDGDSIDLTPGQKSRGQFVGWQEDFTGFFLQTNERNPRYMDLYRYDAKTYDREMLFENSKGYNLLGTSRDGRWVALLMIKDNANDNIFVFDTTMPDQEPRLITRHDGDVSHGFAGFSIDGSTLYYLSDAGNEFRRVWSYGLASHQHELVQEADWDIMFSRLSWNGRYLVTGVNADARTIITILDTATGKPMKMPRLHRGDITGVRIARSENLMAFYLNGDTSPSNLFVQALDKPGARARRLSNTLSKKIDERNLVDSSVIRYPSFDGLEIPALLYKPKLAAPDAKVPALVWVHGGPGGQSRSGYSANIQYLLNHGYAILAVNNRGSSGYGKTFFHLDDRKHGDVDLKDCVHGRKYLETLDWVDADRIGIIGGSYGGYMVAAALAFEPEAFDAGIDIFGVTNWLRTLKSIPPWWASYRRSLFAELGDPEKEEDRLHAYSPLFHASNIKRPLLVVQGANDVRVLKAESDDLVAAVQANGVPVEYIVFDDEGHGFRNKQNRITAAMAYRDFLDRYLKGKRNKD